MGYRGVRIDPCELDCEVHGFAYGFVVLGNDGFYGVMVSARCRDGCDTTETLENVILECIFYPS